MKKGMALLLTLAMLTSLTSCSLVKKVLPGIADALPDVGSIVGDIIDIGIKGSGTGPASVRISNTATPGEALETALMDMMETVKSESQSVGMNLAGAFGVPSQFMSYPTYEMSMSYEFDSYDRDNDEDPIHQVLDGAFVSKTNGTSGTESFSMSMDGETLDSAVYFTGDTVLIRPADQTDPMVRYILPNQGDGAALSVLQPLHRFRAVLCEDNPTWLTGSGWTTYMAELSNIVKAHAGEVTVEQRTATAGGMSADVDTYVLKLSGDAAAAFAANVRGAWLGDIQIRTLLTMAENGVSSNSKEGYILDQLYDVFGGGNMIVSVAASAADGYPAALSYYVESDGGSYFFSATKLGQGNDRATKMATRVSGVSSPTGGGYNFMVENIKSGTSPVVQDNIQTVYSPDGSERLRYITHSEFSGSDRGGSSSFTYTLQQFHDGSPTTMSSSGVFSHEKNGSQINAQFSGQMSSVPDEDDDEDELNIVYNYHGTLMADEKESAIDIPEFIEASGVTVYNRQELSNVLAPDDSDPLPFDGIEKAGAYEQVLYSFIYMMGS